MNILVVEDEPTIARILMRKISALGHKVEGTGKIKEACKLLNEKSYDILFLDYVLEDGRAIDLVKKAKLSDIGRIYMMSAFMDEVDKSLFNQLNVKAFLTKPFDDLDVVLQDL